MELARNGEIHLPVPADLVDEIEIIVGFDRIDRPFDGAGFARTQGEGFSPDPGFAFFAVLHVLDAENIVLRQQTQSCAVCRIGEEHARIAAVLIPSAGRTAVARQIDFRKRFRVHFIRDAQSDQLVRFAGESIENVDAVFLLVQLARDRVERIVAADRDRFGSFARNGEGRTYGIGLSAERDGESVFAVRAGEIRPRKFADLHEIFFLFGGFQSGRSVLLNNDEIADRQGWAALDLPEPVISFEFGTEPDAQDIPFLSGKHVGNVQLDFVCFEVGGQEFGDGQLVIGGIQRIPFVAVADPVNAVVAVDGSEAFVQQTGGVAVRHGAQQAVIDEDLPAGAPAA